MRTTLRPGGRGRWTEPARPAWVRDRPDSHYLALAAVCIGAFMGQLDASIVTVAFPTLQRQFHASLGAVTWVGLSYLVVLIAGVTAFGRLADMVGRKLLYTYGFLVFIVGSGLCAVAPSLLWLDGFRVLQAVGAAMLQANSVALVYLAMPRHRVGRGVGIQGAAQALGLGLGPAIGGLLLAAGGWRLIFLVNIPAGVAGVLAARFFLPRSRNLGARVPFDGVGLALLVPFCADLLVALTFGNSWGWLSPPVLVLLGAAGVLAGSFVVWEKRVPHPLIDLSLFSRVPFAAGVASGLLANVLLFGTLLAVPFLLEAGRHQNAGQVGLTVAALPLALGCTAPVAGRMAERVEARALTVGGMIIASLALVHLGLAPPAGWALVAGLAPVGVGLGLFTPANNAAVMDAAPRSQAGVASGLVNMSRGMGTALGLALAGLVLGRQVHGLVPELAVASGFRSACLLLAAVGACATLTAATRGAAATHGQRGRGGPGRPVGSPG